MEEKKKYRLFVKFSSHSFIYFFSMTQHVLCQRAQGKGGKTGQFSFLGIQGWGSSFFEIEQNSA